MPAPASTHSPPAARYTRIAVVLHWVLAVLIVGNAVLALAIDSLPEDAVRRAVDTHKSIGITVLGLVLLRILWRFAHRPPAMPSTYPRWQHGLAHAAHFALYALMLALPLSGWLHDSAWKDAATHPMQWFGLVEWPRIGAIMSIEPGLKESLHTVFGAAHAWFGYALYALLALHIGAALKHQWLDRQAELQRMWL